MMMRSAQIALLLVLILLMTHTNCKISHTCVHIYVVEVVDEYLATSELLTCYLYED